MEICDVIFLITLRVALLSKDEILQKAIWLFEKLNDEVTRGGATSSWEQAARSHGQTLPCAAQTVSALIGASWYICQIQRVWPVQGRWWLILTQPHQRAARSFFAVGGTTYRPKRQLQKQQDVWFCLLEVPVWRRTAGLSLHLQCLLKDWKSNAHTVVHIHACAHARVHFWLAQAKISMLHFYLKLRVMRRGEKTWYNFIILKA